MSDVIEGDGGGSGAVSLEGRLARLERILTRLESDQVSLEEALALFEEGIAHVRESERVLSETQVRIEELLAGGQTRDVEVDEP